LKNPKKILIIIQRSNGDVFLSSNLICSLFEEYNSPIIDLLVNDDTFPIASLLPHINFIHQFSYLKKKNNRWNQERELITKIYRKYDLSINLTASDRSVLYALLASSFSISAIEKNKRKSWWKIFFLSYHYYFDIDKHILVNNSESLNLLNLNHKNIQKSIDISEEVVESVKNKLAINGINNFIIFHPSAQYKYKIYPRHLRDELLTILNELEIPILITGSKNKIDSKIKKEIPLASNIYNFIGKTSLEEYFVLSQLSMAYIGMDTLNMHIAASQNKPIFAIFGPTNLKMWSPWSNFLQKATIENKPIQTYHNITLFQSSLPCKSCGLIGCGSNHNTDDFIYNIKPKDILSLVKKNLINKSDMNS
jgi:heptosyltransferase III